MLKLLQTNPINSCWATCICR